MNVPLDIPRSSPVTNRVLVSAVVVSFLVCYAGVLSSLGHRWSTSDMYAHGFLIPLISGYMLWERRARLARVPVTSDVPGGILVLGAGLAMLVLGDLGSLISVQQLSLIVSLLGLVLLLWGRQIARETCFPLLYLLFMIPIWDVLTNLAHAPFQRWSAVIGTTVLRTAGIPVRLDGVLLELPTTTLEVAQACSGVNFVVAILAIAIPQSYLMLQSASLRVFVAVMSVLVALVTNGLRVAVIGVMAYAGMTGADIHGPGHAAQGLSVAVVGFVVMFATIHLLAKRTGARRVAESAPSTGSSPLFRTRWVVPRLAVAACLVLVGTASLSAFRRPTAVEPRVSFLGFPSVIEDWSGGLPAASPSYVRGAGADDEVSRRYTNRSGQSVQAYVGYFRQQIQGKEVTSEGVAALHEGASTIQLALPNGPLDANEVVRTIKGRKQYILFWYQLNGRAMSSPYAAKAWTIWQALAFTQSNGAIVMITTDEAPGVELKASAAEAQRFATLMATTLRSYLPN